MAKSLFQKNNREEPAPPTPYQQIEREIDHLKKGKSVRYGPKGRPKSYPWLIILLICALVWLYVMDPVLHAWYKGEAIRTYLYLHNYGSGNLVTDLVATQIFSPDEVNTLNSRAGSFQDYYSSPEAANHEATTIINYMASVRLLHAGKYEQLGPVNKLRCSLFIHYKVPLPTDWGFLDPSVGE